MMVFRSLNGACLALTFFVVLLTVSGSGLQAFPSSGGATDPASNAPSPTTEAGDQRSSGYSNANDYIDFCREQFESAPPCSDVQMLASLRLTDALYCVSLRAALAQARISCTLAHDLDDPRALAAAEMDQALIRGMMEGRDVGKQHFDHAIELYQDAANAEIRAHFFSSAILYKIFRNSGNFDFGEYLDEYQRAIRECNVEHVGLHFQSMVLFDMDRLSDTGLEHRFAEWFQVETISESANRMGFELVLALFEAREQVQQGKLGLAEQKYMDIGRMANQSNHRLFQITAYFKLAQLSSQQKKWSRSLRCLNHCVDLTREYGARSLEADAMIKLAEAFRRTDRADRAVDQIEQALQLPYLKRKSSPLRHEAFKVAMDIYFDVEDYENVRKYARLLTEPSHIRNVVQTLNRNKRLVTQIGELKRQTDDMIDRFAHENLSLQARLDSEQRESAWARRQLNIIAVSSLLLALLVALYATLSRLQRVRARLDEEQESGRQGERLREGLEQKLNRLQRMESLGLLAGGVAHDFNNLLVGVIGNAEMLKLKSGASSDFLEQQIDQIIRSAEKAADLSRQMLAYAGKQPIERSVIDLNRLVERLQPVLNSNLSEAMTLELKLVSQPLVCEVDQTQIEQVVMNLVSNAVSASDDGSRIIIRTGQEVISEVDDESLHGNRIEGGHFNFIEVQDEGGGISMADQERIFEPFYSDRADGRGLGLAVVYGMVNGHQGLIRTRSKLGQGSSFRILIPEAVAGLVESTGSKSAWSDEGQLNVDQPSILIVDDEVSILEMTMQFFQMKGWQVRVARNGWEAMEELQQHHEELSCVLLDIVMPEMGAEDVLEWMREKFVTVPVVLMSGFSQNQIGGFQQDPLVADVLEKPFRLDQLLGCIERAGRSMLTPMVAPPNC